MAHVRLILRRTSPSKSLFGYEKTSQMAGFFVGWVWCALFYPL
ncbi:hypothetical protein JCM19239_4678 [Vibrio variabilis]|uniref:Amino acid permease n=1 Tax=Vibrio variabilis TaxID=990271 RepID=A0ABQ0J861_9VIBR|nr:hypothetical protein JCM19239_4678 [Vibrio variabilis]